MFSSCSFSSPFCVPYSSTTSSLTLSSSYWVPLRHISHFQFLVTYFIIFPSISIQHTLPYSPYSNSFSHTFMYPPSLFVILLFLFLPCMVSLFPFPSSLFKWRTNYRYLLSLLMLTTTKYFSSDFFSESDRMTSLSSLAISRLTVITQRERNTKRQTVPLKANKTWTLMDPSNACIYFH